MKIKIYILLLSTAMLLSSCHLAMMNCFDGSGEIVTDERKVANFDKIKLNSGYDIYLYQGDSSTVMVEIDDNLLKYVRTSVTDRMLEIDDTKSICTRIKKVYITTPNLKKIQVNGASDIVANKPLNYNYLDIEINGASDIYFKELTCPNLKLGISGAGDVNIESGNGGNLLIQASGAGDINFANFRTDSTKVEISGVGDVSVWAEKFLLLKIFGAGDIQYKGTDSTRVVKKIMGAGSVNRF